MGIIETYAKEVYREYRKYLTPSKPKTEPRWRDTTKNRWVEVCRHYIRYLQLKDIQRIEAMNIGYRTGYYYDYNRGMLEFLYNRSHLKYCDDGLIDDDTLLWFENIIPSQSHKAWLIAACLSVELYNSNPDLQFWDYRLAGKDAT